MNHLYRLWRGELTLDNAFWNWAVIGGLFINISSSALFLFLIIGDRPIPALIAGYAVSVPYNVIVCVGVWRSAARYTGERRWAEYAQLATLIGMALLTIT